MADKANDVEEGARALIARYARGERAFPDAELAGVDLTGADLRGIDLARAGMRQAQLGAARLDQANLEEANLMGAHLERASLTAANLDEANLMGALMREARLEDAAITRAILVYVDARDADLVGADLCGVDLSGADLSHADLTGASLAGASLVGARLEGAILTEAILDGADLTDAKLGGDADLLACRWSTLLVGGVVYVRADVERGAQTLPVGGGDPLAFVFQSTRSLTADDLLAVRDLVRAFARLVSGARLTFEVAASGDRVVLGCGGDSRRGYRDAFELGLSLIRAAQQPTARPSRVRMSRDLADGLRALSTRPPPPDSSPELERLIACTESSADAIARMLTAFEPIRLQFRSADDVHAFRTTAEARGIELDDLIGAEAGWTLLPRFVAHYLGLALSSPALPEGLLGDSVPPAAASL